MNPATLKKLVLGYLLVVPVLVLIDVVHYLAVQGVVNSNRRLASANEILREVDGVASGLQQAGGELDDYLAHKKGVALTPFINHVAQVRDGLQHLVQLTRGDAAQVDRVRKLEPAVNNRLELFQRAVDLQAKEGSNPAKQQDWAAQGEKQMESIRAILAEMKKYELERLPAYGKVAQETVERVSILTPVEAVLGVWMALMAALLLYRDAMQRTWSGIERRIHTRLVETLPFGVCMVDEHGLIFLTNPAQDNLLGFEPGGLIGRHITTLHDASRSEGESAFEQAMQDLAQRGEWRGEFLARRKNATTFNCVCQAVNMELAGKMYRVFLLAAANPRPTE